MDLQQVSEHLNLLSRSNRKEVFDILFNLGHIYKEFKELLAITHVSSNRKAIVKAKQSGRVKMEPVRPMAIPTRIQRLINGREASFNSFEYHILFTLVESPHVTPGIRVSLQESLAYVINVIGTEKVILTCAICSYVGSKDICLSCKRNLLDYTISRRESFVVPINFLNFNIRGTINYEGAVSFTYNDWCITKQGTSITYTLSELEEGSEPIQYDLPFVENQKVITS